MRARLLGVDEPLWESFLRDVRYDFYHLPSYAALGAVQEGGEAKALYVEDGERSVLLPLILRAVPGSESRDATSPYGYPGPLLRGTDDPRFLSDALGAGLAALRDAGSVTLFVRLHPQLNPEPPVGVGEVVLHGTTVSVDLTAPSATRWAQMRENHRRDITRAIRNGLVARVDDSAERYGEFKQIYHGTMERRSAAPYYHFGDEYFDRLRDALGERLHLLVVEKDGGTAAAGIFIETDGIAQYHLGGTAEASAGAEPSKLLIHAACDWAEKRGNRTLHLGGGVGGAADSLFLFKAGFSPLRHPYRTLRVVLDEVEYRRLVAARDPAVDPDDLGGYFPPYRLS
jgi:hypothetical protein